MLDSQERTKTGGRESKRGEKAAVDRKEDGHAKIDTIACPMERQKYRERTGKWREEERYGMEHRR